jgi:hypothetical protein
MAGSDWKDDPAIPPSEIPHLRVMERVRPGTLDTSDEHLRAVLAGGQNIDAHRRERWKLFLGVVRESLLRTLDDAIKAAEAYALAERRCLRRALKRTGRIAQLHRCEWMLQLSITNAVRFLDDRRRARLAWGAFRMSHGDAVASQTTPLHGDEGAAADAALSSNVPEVVCEDARPAAPPPRAAKRGRVKKGDPRGTTVVPGGSNP